MGNTLRKFKERKSSEKILNFIEEDDIALYSPTTIIDFKGELWLCGPLLIALKQLPRPDMHVIADSMQAMCLVDVEFIMPYERESVICLDESLDENELLERKIPKKPLAMLVVPWTPRAMATRHAKIVRKAKTVAENVLFVVFYGPFTPQGGRIRTLNEYGIPSVLEIVTKGHLCTQDQYDICKSLLWNPVLFNSVDQYEKHVEQCKRVRSQLELSNLEFKLEDEYVASSSNIQSLSVNKLSDELIEIRCESITWRGGDWIGVFRPNKRDEAHCIAKFKVRENRNFIRAKICPVPYGDIVFQYFKSEFVRNTLLADSEVTSYGNEISARLVEGPSPSLNIVVSGDLPIKWSIYLVTPTNNLLKGEKEEQGQQVSFHLEDSNWQHEKLILKVVADAGGDCLATRKIEVETA